MLMHERVVKFPFTPVKALKSQRGRRGIALFFLLTLALDEGGWSAPPRLL